MKVQNRDFVIVGLQDWDSPIGSNCINTAEEIARDNRVLYINPPVDRITALQKKKEAKYILDNRHAVLSGNTDQLKQVNNRLWVYTPTKLIESINVLPDGRVYDFFNKYNNKRFASEIQEAIDKLNFKNFVLFNDGDMFRSFYLKELLKPQLSIYYTRDYFLAVEYWRKHGERLEPALMKKSDLVVSNSLYLNQLAKRYNENAHYIGQGCDFSLFDPQKTEKIPDDLNTIAHPRIGYIGALLDLRLDIALLEHIAAARKDWQIILIGPEDGAFQQSKLHQMKNVHFLGPRPMHTLASYLRGFDVAINPQKLNEVTIGNYPRKIDEYLAMGLPVVATATETMQAFKDHVYLGSSPEDYLRLIEEAIAEDKDQLQRERRKFALDHTWENSVSELYKALINTSPVHAN